MSNVYRENFIRNIIQNSVSNGWEDVVLEWEIIDCIEDDSLSESCICGKEDLKYLYTIKNKYNKKEIFPIGSSCIKKFEREDFKDEIAVTEGMFKLLHAVEKNEFITLSTEFFSRKLLEALYEKGAFKPSEYNNYDGYNDYEFLCKMFNKRDKSSITSGQHRKIRGIIVGSIRPYLEEKLNGKIITLKE